MTNFDIYSATEDITLIRVVGSIWVQQRAADSSSNFAFVLIYAQEGWAIASFTSFDTGLITLTGREAASVLYAQRNEGLGVYSRPVVLQLDIKSMRKMESGDTIKFVFDMGANAIMDYSWALTLFFKEK